MYNKAIDKLRDEMAEDGSNKYAGAVHFAGEKGSGRMKQKTLMAIHKHLKNDAETLSNRVIEVVRNYGKATTGDILEAYKAAYEALEDFEDWRQEHEADDNAP